MSEKNYIKKFYEDYCTTDFDETSEKNNLKKEYFNYRLPNGILYKYISFNEDKNLNDIKIHTIKSNMLWFAAHHTLSDNDPSEFNINVNTAKVSAATGMLECKIRSLIESFRELNNVCCLSDRLDEQMWNRYANNHSGCCLVFKIRDYDKLMPVIYCKKEDIDLTDFFIKSFKSVTNIKSSKLDIFSISVLTFIPFVLKDESQYGYEHEVRLLCGDDLDDDTGYLGGKIFPYKKEFLNYQGARYSYKKCGLELQKIIIGKNTPINIKREFEGLDVNIEIE